MLINVYAGCWVEPKNVSGVVFEWEARPTVRIKLYHGDDIKIYMDSSKETFHVIDRISTTINQSLAPKGDDPYRHLWAKYV